MRKPINQSHVEGYIYEHKLEEKTSGPNSKNPGTEFISGTLSVATDNEMTNVVQVHFTYVTPVTKQGKPNATYNVLKSIIDGKIGAAMSDGKENAGMVRIDTAIALNEWYDTRNDGALVSVKRNEGGFVHQTQELGSEDQRATFETDMLITAVTRFEANEEKDTPERVILKGCIFDFRQAILPVEFTVLDAGGMDYFEGLGASSKTPVFTRVKGKQVSKTIVRTIEEESAFGEASVREVRNSQRDFVVTWAQQDPYEWDSEAGILASELSEKMADREVYLADIKKRQEEYQTSKNSGPSAFDSTAAAPAKGEYNF